MIYSPIILFVYNRPESTIEVLKSLANNKEAKFSDLIIFCDGPKNDNEILLSQINKVKEIVKSENRFGSVKIIENKFNKGLAKSVFDGVSEVFSSYDRIIVLEDDLIVSPFFLKYMNDSLNRYELNESVGQIGACNYFACGSKYPSSFFIPIADCWGWATWQNRWEKYIHSIEEIEYNLEKDKKLLNKFNAYGSYNFSRLLNLQKSKTVSSWAIHWHSTCILNNWLILYPNPSMSQHISSLDFTHETINITPPLCTEEPIFETKDVIEIYGVIKAMKRGYSMIGDYYGNLSFKLILLKMINSVKKRFSRITTKL
jgi:hypothetical protein